jgi:alkylhydroperoxidase family enzyme
MEEVRHGEGLAGVDDRLRPLLQYARKLTEFPSSVTAEDAQAVYDAGWDEQALHDAILVVCCFNFMNRLLDGHGVHGDAALFRSRGTFLQRHGYRGLIDSLRR